jgi:protein SCO1/2
MAGRHRSKPVRWLSLSIDALGDDPARLQAWQHKLGSQPAWQAAVPAVRDVDRLVAFLRGGPAGGDTHTTQVFGFDREGRLAYRTGDATPVALLDQLVDALI